MTGPQSLRALLAAYRPAGERTRAGGEAGALAAAWPESVGADVARRTRAATYRDGTLTVLTPSSAWSHQLTFLAPTIIERLRERCPGVDLRRLKFIVATGRSRALLVGAAPARRRRATSGARGPRARGLTTAPLRGKASRNCCSACAGNRRRSTRSARKPVGGGAPHAAAGRMPRRGRPYASCAPMRRAAPPTAASPGRSRARRGCRSKSCANICPASTRAATNACGAR